MKGITIIMKKSQRLRCFYSSSGRLSISAYQATVSPERTARRWKRPQSRVKVETRNGNPVGTMDLAQPVK